MLKKSCFKVVTVILFFGVENEKLYLAWHKILILKIYLAYTFNGMQHGLRLVILQFFQIYSINLKRNLVFS